MRVAGSFIAFAAFVSGVSATRQEPSKPSEEQLKKPARAKPRKPPTKRVDRAYIFQHAHFDESDMPRTAYGYPYQAKAPEVVAAEEQGHALKQLAKDAKDAKENKAMQLSTDREARAWARIKELQAKREDHQAKAKALKVKAKAAAVKKHLTDVLKIPLDGPIRSAKEETLECAQKPWPPHVEAHEEVVPQAPEVLAAEPAKANVADNSLSAVESRPAVQGAAREKPKMETWAKETNWLYLKKCRQIFDGLDFDGDLSIEEEEVFAFFDTAWHVYDPAELTQKFLAEADQDRDRKVSTAEWNDFAHEAQRTGLSKEERWDPLQHLKGGLSANREDDMENSTDQLNGYYKRITARLFRVMDANGNDVASKAEMQAFLDKKYPKKDPVEFSEKVLAEADADGDSNVTMSEFQNFAAGSRGMSTSLQEKWNPLLHVIGTVRRNSAYVAPSFS